jgi:hypothetical protein
MSNRADAAKVKSTDKAQIQKKNNARDVSTGNIMDGDVRSEYDFLKLHQLKAEIRDNVGGGEEMAKLAKNFKEESESEVVAAKMLTYLNGLSDYSAEFAQISSVAGMTSRVAIAADLAKKYCDSHSTQIVLDKIMGGEAKSKETMSLAFANINETDRKAAINEWSDKKTAAVKAAAEAYEE